MHFSINIFLIILFFGPSIVTAQAHDSHWLFAWTSQPLPSGVPGFHFEFSPNLDYYSDTIGIQILGSNATYSTATGALDYMSNGIHIFDKTGAILENGETINPGIINEEYKDIGYPTEQTLTFLPAPKDSSSTFLVHTAYDYVQDLGGVGMQYYYSKIEKDSLGNSVVSQKNQIIVEDTLGKPYVTAIRHGNGQDWWLIMPTIASNHYYINLLDSSGAKVYREQDIGYTYEVRAWSGQSVVSPDGSKYARYDRFNKLNIFDFDRCTGTLSNPLHIAHPFASPDSLVDGGVAISPNSRYLYLTVAAWVYQYDLWASDVAASRVLVGEYDGTQAPFLPTIFLWSQLGQDGKIYCMPSATNTMHIIHAPDSAGLACRVENNALHFDYIHSPGSMPYFPNYRLGPLMGSPCDTLGLVSSNQDLENQAKKALSLSPNPARQYFRAEIQVQDYSELSALRIEVFDALGRLVFEEAVPPYAAMREVDCGAWPAGLYSVVLRGSGRVLAVERVLVW